MQLKEKSREIDTLRMEVKKLEQELEVVRLCDPAPKRAMTILSFIFMKIVVSYIFM